MPFWQAVHADIPVILWKLRRTPLLWGWIVLGAVCTFAIWEWRGLAVMALNFMLLGVYVLLIRYFTSPPPQPMPIRRPRLELGAALGWVGVSMLFALSFHGLLNLGRLSQWQLHGIPEATTAFAERLNWPGWTTDELVNAAMNFPFQLLPVVLLFLLLGYGLRGLGLGWRGGYGKLVGALLLINILLGLPFHAQLFGGHDLWQILALFVIGLFINALPEELFFRGLLLPRLEPFTGGLNAVVVSALLFSASHIPSFIAQLGASLWMAVLISLSLAFPSGLAWGYLYYRTRSIVPGVLWHGATSMLGLTFIGI